MLDALLSDMIGDELLRNPSFIQTPLEDYCRKLANRASIIIHFDNQKPLGMIAYYCNDLKTGSVYITSIIVDPEARRGGVGQRLVRAALDHGQSLGFQRCELEVSASNTQAIRFYQKLGFEWSEKQAGLMQCPI
jgi:ribosomal protein S18 acetylase RimI-like enzyme